MKKLIQPWLVLVPSFKLSLDTFDDLLQKGGYKALVLSMLGLIVFWHIYTPIHELLHVAGALLTGGEVTELALKPQYGGTLLAKVFPFVVAESNYAGQLTGFSVPNDFAYFIVDMLPYVLSLFGLALTAWSRKRNHAFIFGLAIILTWIPFLALPGDYYEAASLLTSAIYQIIDPQAGAHALLSDDVFKLVSTLHGEGSLNLMKGVFIGIGLVLGFWLALITLAIQSIILDRFTKTGTDANAS